MEDAGMDTSPADVGMDTGAPDTGPPFDPNGDPDLILWLPMDDTGSLGGAVEERGGMGVAVRCSAGSCPQSGEAGQTRSAFGFDGSNDRLVIMDSPTLVTSSGFTLAVWVRLPTAVVSDDMVVLAKPFGGSFRNSWELGFIDVDSDGEGELSFVVDSTGGEATASAEHGLPGGTWSHVAAVWEPSGRRLMLYLDGELRATSAESVRPSFDSSDGFVGADDNGSGPTNFFEGLVDDARIYRRALTAAEIAAVMSAPRP